ncbi:MAG: ABC transporter permease subunit [Mobilitalea sp.]
MIFKHELKANFKTFLIWTSIIAGMDFGFMLMFPSLQDSMDKAMSAYESVGAFSTAFGMDRLSMADPLGYYGVYIGAILSLGGALFAAIVGTGILSKEEGGHTSEFLYTLPYSRLTIVLQKVAAVFVILFAFNAVNLLLGLLSFPLIHAKLMLQELLLYHAAQFMMHLEIAAIGILLSAFTKKISIGIGLGIAMLLYFLDMMSRVLPQLKFGKYITPFYYANAADVMPTRGIDPLLLGIGIGLTLLCIAIGGLYYNKRDLAA